MTDRRMFLASSLLGLASAFASTSTGLAAGGNDMARIAELVSSKLSLLTDSYNAQAKTLITPVYNVVGYGAKGDGVTDDTAAIQSAIDAAIAAGSKTVYLPTGVYKVTSLANTSSVILVGDNASFSGVSTPIREIGDSFGANIQDLPDIRWKSDGVQMLGINSENPVFARLTGFRFRGKYSNPRSNVVVLGTTEFNITYSGSLDAGTVQTNNWYGVFAVDAGGGVLGGKFTTFVRVNAYNSTTNVITAGTHTDATIVRDYGWATNAYASGKVIVLTGTERGKIISLTANASGTITHGGAALSLVQGDWLLLAPSGYTNFRHIGAVFADATPQTLNFFKSGDRYWSYHSLAAPINQSSPVANTAYLVNMQNALVPPTAREVTLRLYMTSNAAGSCALVASPDNIHATRQILTTFTATDQMAGATFDVMCHWNDLQCYAWVSASNISLLSGQVYGWAE